MSTLADGLLLWYLTEIEAGIVEMMCRNRSRQLHSDSPGKVYKYVYSFASAFTYTLATNRA